MYRQAGAAAALGWQPRRLARNNDRGGTGKRSTPRRFLTDQRF
jgi:hypothetical protein